MCSHHANQDELKGNEYPHPIFVAFFFFSFFFLLFGLSECVTLNVKTKIEVFRVENLTANNFGASVKLKEAQLAHLQEELHHKQAQLASKQEDVNQFWNDVHSLMAQLPSPSICQSSAATRMQEEHEKQKILEAWRLSSSSDPVIQSRQYIITTWQEISLLNLQIAKVKKDLSSLHVATPDNSAQQRMHTEHQQREQTPKHTKRPTSNEQSPQESILPPPVPLKSHQQRMAEQLALKAKARTAHLSH